MILKELLDTPLMKDAEVLAAKEEIEKSFTCIATEEYGENVPGFLMFSTEKNEDEGWRGYVIRMHQKGAAGLALIGRKKTSFALTEELFRTCQEYQMPLIYIPTDNLTLFMMRLKAFLQDDYNVQYRSENWMYRLCSRQKISVDMEEARRYGYRAEYHYYCLVMELDTMKLKGRRMAEKMLMEAYGIVESAFSLGNVKVLHFSEKDMQVCFLPVLPEASLEEMEKQIRNVVRKINMKTGMNWRVNVGSRAEKLEEFYYSFQNGLKVAETAAEYGSREIVHFYEEWQMLILFLYAPEYELKKYVKCWLGPILDNEMLMDTFSVYILTYGNLKKTAESLYIHQNTLKYRLDRISGALHCNVRDTDRLVVFHTAFIIYWRMKGLNHGAMQKVTEYWKQENEKTE